MTYWPLILLSHALLVAETLPTETEKSTTESTTLPTTSCITETETPTTCITETTPPTTPCETDCWTQWFDRDDPSGSGDWETLLDLHQEYSGKICFNPLQIEVLTTAGLPVSSTRDVIFVSDVVTGFICRKADQRKGRCSDYKVRFLCPPEFCLPPPTETLPTETEKSTTESTTVPTTSCITETETPTTCITETTPPTTPCETDCWTQWFDRDDPSGSGDWETLSNLYQEYSGKICFNPLEIEVLTTAGLPVSSTRDVIFVSDVVTGFICRKADQRKGRCSDYKVRFLCPPEFCLPPPTETLPTETEKSTTESTTVPTTSCITETETPTTCITETTPPTTPCETDCWTQWFDRDDPSGSGDWETLSNLYQEYSGKICFNPLEIEVLTTAGLPVSSTRDVIFVSDVVTGFICRKADQRKGRCSDYKVRFLCPPEFCLPPPTETLPTETEKSTTESTTVPTTSCITETETPTTCITETTPPTTPCETDCWTQWFDRDDPSGSGDWETLSNLYQEYSGKICFNPLEIEVLTTAGLPVSSTRDVIFVSDVVTGFICRKADQRKGRCSDYKVRFLCPPEFCLPPPTETLPTETESTTLPTTSCITETETPTTCITETTPPTTPFETVETLPTTLPTTSCITETETPTTCITETTPPTTPCETEFWTQWFDRDDPSVTGDWETLLHLHLEYPGIICPYPLEIEVLTVTGLPVSSTGDVIYKCDVLRGFLCRNSDQKKRLCSDYKVRFLCPSEFCDPPPKCWTQWFDRDDPSGSGDWEILSNLHQENPGKICSNPLQIEVLTTAGLPVWSTGDFIFKSDVVTGFICRKSDQRKGRCSDYKVRFLCPPEFCLPPPTEILPTETETTVPPTSCLTETETPTAFIIESTPPSMPYCWTQWFDRDDPSGSGDWETLLHLDLDYPGKICSNPLQIEVLTITGLPFWSTGEVIYKCNVLRGFLCRNSDQKNGQCSDYKVRFLCPPEFCLPPPTETLPTTLPTTSCITETETPTTCITETTPPTTPCETAKTESTTESTTVPTTSCITETETPTTCITETTPPTTPCVTVETLPTTPPTTSCITETETPTTCITETTPPTTPCETDCWTQWFDRDDPSVTGDWETLSNLYQEYAGKICSNPLQIEVLTTAGLPVSSTGDVIYKSDVVTGFICRNADQKKRLCSDYKVRFLCPPEFCLPPPTETLPTTLPTTSCITETETPTTCITETTPPTTPCVTVETLPTTLPTTSCITETETPTTCITETTPPTTPCVTAETLPTTLPTTSCITETETPTTCVTETTPPTTPCVTVETLPTTLPTTSCITETETPTTCITETTPPTTPCETDCWTQWFDRDDPSVTGDWETLSNLYQEYAGKICSNPLQIEVLTTAGLPVSSTGDVIYKSDVVTGFICRNADQKKRLCSDYKVRFLCPPEFCLPPPTETLPTTLPTTSCITETETPTTCITKTTPPTTPCVTVETLPTTLPTTSCITETETPTTCITETTPPTTPCETDCWTQWFDRDDPSVTGDWETLSNLYQEYAGKICSNPLQIEVLTTAGLPVSSTGDIIYKSDVVTGFICRNADQKKRLCSDYKVRFLCPPEFCLPPPTETLPTTLPTTSCITETETPTTCITETTPPTTPCVTVETLPTTLPTTSCITETETPTTCITETTPPTTPCETDCWTQWFDRDDPSVTGDWETLSNLYQEYAGKICSNPLQIEVLTTAGLPVSSTGDVIYKSDVVTGFICRNADQKKRLCSDYKVRFLCPPEFCLPPPTETLPTTLPTTSCITETETPTTCITETTPPTTPCVTVETLPTTLPTTSCITETETPTTCITETTPPTTPCETDCWTQWFDRDDPSVTGDWETLSNLYQEYSGKICSNPLQIEVLTTAGLPVSSTGDVIYKSDVVTGFICRNADQKKRLCSDYKVRFLCPPEFCLPPPTETLPTTLPTTSCITETETPTTCITETTPPTTPCVTVETLPTTLPTTSCITETETPTTCITETTPPTTPCETDCWTQWFDRDDPSVTGDWETLSNLYQEYAGKICSNPLQIEVLTTAGLPVSSTGDIIYKSDVVTGFICRNADQKKRLCSDYKVRFLCPPEFCLPPPTETLPTTLPTTSCITETETPTTCITETTPPTTPCVTAETLPTTAPTTSCITETETTRIPCQPVTFDSTRTRSTRPLDKYCWTQWFNRDDPFGTGDWETLLNFRMENPGKICSKPLQIQVLTTAGMPVWTTGDVIYKSDTETGFICRNKDQKTDWCSDYMVRFMCPPKYCAPPPTCWTEWFDRDDPTGTGDWETLHDLWFENPGQICSKPLQIQVQTTSGAPLSSTGDQIYKADAVFGFICRNSDQKKGNCQDYQVRFMCPLDFCVQSNCWTTWFDSDDPIGTGDWETLADLRTMYPKEICDTPLQIQAQTTTGMPASQAGNVLAAYDTTIGLICKNWEQRKGVRCNDFQVRFLCPPNFCQAKGCYTEWFDRDDPSSSGDWETLFSLRAEHPGLICNNPLQIQVQSLDGKSVVETGNVIEVEDVTTGFICKNSAQPSGQCEDFRVRFFCPLKFCQQKVCWTRWFDRDDPSDPGDWELLSDLRDEYPAEICETPLYIDVRTVDTNEPITATGQTLHIYSPTKGIVCQNKDQEGCICRDYKVRFGCPCKCVTDTD